MTSSGATNTNSYQFTGRENDGTTGLYFFRARYYNPTFGRFISEDPLPFPAGSDPNLYGYVGNYPTMLVDPLGLDPGNGCGFLGWSCAVDAFTSLLDSLCGGVSCGDLWSEMWRNPVASWEAGSDTVCGDTLLGRAIRMFSYVDAKPLPLKAFMFGTSIMRIYQKQMIKVVGPGPEAFAATTAGKIASGASTGVFIITGSATVASVICKIGTALTS